MKLTIITCYFDPDYIRSRTLRAALLANPAVELDIIKNKQLGFSRYFEVAIKLIKQRFVSRPDAYILTFRGQEMLWLILLIAGKRPVIFDEFIVPLAWASERHRRTARTIIFTLLARVSAPLYTRWLSRCRFILTDTTEHAGLSAKLSGLDQKRYITVPVGTDETLFKPAPHRPIKKGAFEVFFYGSKMTPLHGLPYILQAIELVSKKTPDITFRISGGSAATAKTIKKLIDKGLPITYHRWIAFDDLAPTMQSAGICLCGPFGATTQANHVVTGKTYQALACAAPVIVGDTLATKDFTDKLDCLKVPLGNAEALAEAIIWAHSHPKQLATIAETGRQLYERQFSGNFIAKQVLTMINQL